MAQPSHDTDRTDVETFVRAAYLHGLPYEAAARYTPEDAAVLIGMLQNSKDAIFWPNITMVLGVTASKDTAAALTTELIRFLEDRDGSAEWSSTVYRGRVSALAGLAYIVNQTNDAETLDYLLGSVYRNVWIDRDLPWLTAREDSERLLLDLRSSAVLALALTGHAAAVETLSALESPESDDAAALRLERIAASVRPDLMTIRKYGLAKYYDDSLPAVAQR